jgi:Kdo2-lipid IVA lauroyltransferase/acyltransferase
MGSVLLHLLFSSLQCLFFCCPHALRQRLICVLGFVLQKMAPRRRREVVRRNVERMFPGEAWIPRLFWRHFVRTCLYLPVLYGTRRLAHGFLRKRVQLEGLEHWNKALALGRGACFLSSHVGHWEIMAAKGAEAKPNQLWLVTKALKPRFFHFFLEKKRRGLGIQATYEPRVMETVAKVLKAGHTVGWVLDQYAGPPISVRVPFFGVCVGTSLGFAMSVRRYKVPVLPVESFRQEDGSWMVRIHPHQGPTPLAGRSVKQALAEDTAHYTLIVEEMIRRHPEQWLWTHRRFKGDLSPLPASSWGRRMRAVLALLLFFQGFSSEAVVPYAGGETLEYGVKYFGLPAGQCTLSAVDDTFEGHPVYRLEALATSVPPFAWVYKIKDVLRSFQDVDHLYSHAFEMDLKETAQTRLTRERYLHEAKKMIRDDNWKHSKREHIITALEEPMDPFGQDSFSALYFVRTLALKEGVPETFHVFSEGKKLLFVATRLPGQDIFEVDGKPMKSLSLKLQTRWSGVMEQQKREDSILWLSDDFKRYPLQLKAKIKLGTLVARLKKVRP